MLAYVFWHRPRDGTEAGVYEDANVAFHRSLVHRRPVGMRGSCALRVAELPWLRAPRAAGDEAAPHGGDGQPAGGGYEDWYVVDDFTALGVLNEAAVGRGHRASHDRVARRAGAGAGGVYALVEGCAGVTEAAQATWVALPQGAAPREVFELLGDGIDPSRASLWRRQLVLGPAPEFCLLSPEAPPGVAPTRLPAGWTAVTLERRTLFSSR